LRRIRLRSTAVANQNEMRPETIRRAMLIHISSAFVSSQIFTIRRMNRLRDPDPPTPATHHRAAPLTTLYPVTVEQ
jgi:hypothetical protein